MILLQFSPPTTFLIKGTAELTNDKEKNPLFCSWFLVFNYFDSSIFYQ